MKQKTFIIFMLLLITANLFGQGARYAWAAGIGSNLFDRGSAITVDNKGNLYVTGDFTGTVDFDPGPGVTSLTSDTNARVFVSKYDVEGNLKWVKQLGGIYSFALTVDKDGNVYTSGEFEYYGDFNPGPDTLNLYSYGYYDIFVSKLDSTGNFVWAKSIGGLANEYNYSLATDQNQNVYITGSLYYIIDFDPGVGTHELFSFGDSDIYILKLDSMGDFLWVKQLEGNLDSQPYSIDIRDDGSIFSTGFFNGTVDFDPDPLATHYLSSGGFDTDIYILKLDAMGNFMWAKSIGSYNDDRAYDIDFDQFGNIYTTGYFMQTVDFDPGPSVHNLTAVGDFDAFVLKLDSVGNFLWVNSIGGTNNDEGLSVACDAIGNVYVSGYYRDTATINPNVGGFTLDYFAYDNIYIASFNSNGDFNWAKNYGGWATDKGTSIAVDLSNNIFVTGHFSGVINFDPANTSNYLYSAGQADLFILALAPCDESTTELFVSQCTSYLFNGQELTSSGTYYDILQSSTGCDSIITLNLTINSPSSATINESACQHYDFNGTLLTASGTYYDTLTNANGCDSLITLNLTITEFESSTIYDTACYNYIFNGTLFGVSGTYVDTFLNAMGCDTITTLFLTIVEIDTSISQATNELFANAMGADYQWIDCTNGNIIIPGETNQNFMPIYNGNYACIITQNGCIDTSGCHSISTIAIEETKACSEIKIYPNPANEKLYIDLGSKSGSHLESHYDVPTRIEILNNRGQIVGKQKICNNPVIVLDVKHLPTGKYFVTISNKKGIVFVNDLIINN